jgi:hypothetical protein
LPEKSDRSTVLQTSVRFNDSCIANLESSVQDPELREKLRPASPWTLDHFREETSEPRLNDYEQR